MKKYFLNLDIRVLNAFKRNTQEFTYLFKEFTNKINIYISIMIKENTDITDKNLDSKIKEILNEFNVKEILSIKKDIIKDNNIKKNYLEVIYNYNSKLRLQINKIDRFIKLVKES